jgi:hypothetical protein
MKHFIGMFFLSVMLVFNGSLALAMDHSSHKGHDMSGGQDNMKEHGGMGAEGSMFMLENSSVSGVTGMAHVKDVSAAMSNMGMATTHHFMVKLVDEKTGKAIESGSAAVKIKGPDGQLSDPIQLMGMSGQFGADVSLPGKGPNVFIVGTRLDDGQKRTFEFNFDYK